MSDYGRPSQFKHQPYPQPAPPKKKRHTFRTVALIVGGLFALLIVAAVLSPGQPAKEATAGAVAKTVTVPGAKTTVTKTVATVPAACREALDAADQVIATAGEGFSITAEAMGAASELDADGITAATVKLTALNRDKLTPQLAAYKSARDECNGS